MAEMTGNEISTPTRFTAPTMSSMPSYSDSLSTLPVLNIFTHRVDDPCNFVARNPRVLNARK